MVLFNFLYEGKQAIDKRDKEIQHRERVIKSQRQIVTKSYLQPRQSSSFLNILPSLLRQEDNISEYSTGNEKVID